MRVLSLLKISNSVTVVPALIRPAGHRPDRPPAARPAGVAPTWSREKICQWPGVDCDSHLEGCAIMIS